MSGFFLAKINKHESHTSEFGHICALSFHSKRFAYFVSVCLLFILKITYFSILIAETQKWSVIRKCGDLLKAIAKYFFYEKYTVEMRHNWLQSYTFILVLMCLLGNNPFSNLDCRDSQIEHYQKLCQFMESHN